MRERIYRLTVINVLLLSLLNFSTIAAPSQADVTSANLVVNLDATDSLSYSGTGSTWTNLVDNSNKTISNAAYNSENGGSIVFGGATFVDIGTPLSSNASFTKEAWVYDSSGTGPRNILSSSNTVFWLNGTTLSGGVAGSYSLVTKASFPKNAWQHVLLTFDDTTDTMTLYVNGVQVSQNTGVTARYTQETMRIGSHVSGDTPVSFWNGRISKVRVYNAALTQAQVMTNEVQKFPS
jgi:hypothetical protein